MSCLFSRSHTSNSVCHLSIGFLDSRVTRFEFLFTEGKKNWSLCFVFAWFRRVSVGAGSCWKLCKIGRADTRNPLEILRWRFAALARRRADLHDRVTRFREFPLIEQKSGYSLPMVWDLQPIRKLKGSKRKNVNGQILEKAANLRAYFYLDFWPFRSPRDDSSKSLWRFPNSPSARSKIFQTFYSSSYFLAAQIFV